MGLWSLLECDCRLSVWTIEMVVFPTYVVITGHMFCLPASCVLIQCNPLCIINKGVSNEWRRWIIPDREHTVRNRLAQNGCECQWSERYCQYTCSHTELAVSPWPSGIDKRGIFNGPSKERKMSKPICFRLLCSYIQGIQLKESQQNYQNGRLSVLIVFIENVRKIAANTHMLYNESSTVATASYDFSLLFASYTDFTLILIACVAMPISAEINTTLSLLESPMMNALLYCLKWIPLPSWSDLP